MGKEVRSPDLSPEASIDRRACSTCGKSFPPSFSVCPHDATPLDLDSEGRGDRLIGAILAGTYKITEVIGEGGMARLYAAEHLRLENRYAVKVIHDDLAKSTELLARFEREARAAARIRSDHVVRVIDVLQTPDKRPAIVTELLDGEDLSDRLERVGRLEARRAIPIARQICRALIAAHACGVVHRDLKPSNVYLARDGDEMVVKVLDFGVAKVDDKSELTKTGAIVGTLAYMAPEQARRAADAGPPADIYQVGAVLYHMLTGQPPYGASPAINPLVLLLGGPPAAPRTIEPSIDAGVAALVETAMAREPEQRPASAADLESQLAALELGEREASAGAAEVDGGDDERVEPRAETPASPSALSSLGREARVARPITVLLACAAVVAIGLWAASILAALVAGGDARSGGERTLIALVSVALAGGAGVVLIRAVRNRWRSLPAIQQTRQTLRRGLGAGLITFAVLELLAVGFTALSVDALGASAGGWAWRLALAAVAAAGGVAWPRLSRTAPIRRLLST